MTRSYGSQFEALDTIKRYFCNRAMANGRKCMPKIKPGEMDYDGEFWFRTFTTRTLGMARLTFDTYSCRVETEY